MIFQALNIIQTQLNGYVIDDGSAISASLGNIGEIISGGNLNSTDEDIIISLINVEENRISRDPKNYTRSGTDIFRKNPPVHLNLTLLFTAVRSESAYGLALKHLQGVFEFFQGKYVFDRTTDFALFANTNIEKLVLEMVTLSIEQLNQLWSVMGGRYQPSVVYRMRMVTIDSVTNVPGSVITEVNTKYNMI